MRAKSFHPKGAACGIFLASLVTFSTARVNHRAVHHDLHFSLKARGSNTDGSLPTYKNPNASIEDRVNDLLPRMTLQEKVAQIMQGDMNGWMDFTDPRNNTLSHNVTGLQQMMEQKGGLIWGSYEASWEKIVYGITVGQRYLMENTSLGIPAIFQSEGLHGFTDNGTTFPSPIALAASFNTHLLQEVADAISTEAEALGYNQLFGPVLDLSRELRWGRVEESFGEDPYLSAMMGRAYVTGIQTGRRLNASEQATARMAATCKHFAAYGSPEGGLNTAPVTGGVRDLHTYYLKPFKHACMDALSIMSAYSAYDGVPCVANEYLLNRTLRHEWNYENIVITDAGATDMLINVHGICETRECAAKATLENGLSVEMGGGSSTYLTLAEQVKDGTVDVEYLDKTVKTVLRTKFKLGLFENPYPYANYASTMRTQATRDILHQMERETIVLLENRNKTLPLSTNIGSVAVIGPQASKVSLGDYVFETAINNSIPPLQGFTEFLLNSSVKINFVEGCKLWSTDESDFQNAVTAAKQSDVAILFVGTWSLDQQHLWLPGTNATTGEHVDLSDLSLVGAQLRLVQAIQAIGTPTIVVFVSGKPVTEPWIQENAAAVIQQFYGGELYGHAIAEVIFGATNPSGKLPVSFPRSVGTLPAFYNYLKGSRPVDPGHVYPNGTLQFGHQYVLDSPAPLWNFGHGLSYTEFNYTDLELSSSTIGPGDDFNVSLVVHNSGSMDGMEVVQVYMTDLYSSVVTPNKELIGFTKVDIPAGQSQTVTIPVMSSQLAVWTLSHKFVVELGNFSITVGTSEEVYLNTTLTVK